MKGENFPAVVMFVKRRKVANSNNNVILSNVNYENNGNGQVAKSRCGKHKDCNGGTSEVIIIELFFLFVHSNCTACGCLVHNTFITTRGEWHCAASF